MLVLTLLHLLACGATAFKSLDDLPQDVSGYSVSRLTKATGSGQQKQPSELTVTDNVLRLRRATAGSSTSSTYVQALNGRKGTERAVNGSTALQAVSGGAVFLADITVGGQDFSVVIDTGSSDPWLVVSSFQCYDYYDNSPVDQRYCYFGPSYNESSTFQSIPNENFNISYADGEYLAGGMGYETFTMAGITVPNQQFGVVDEAAWVGDTYSSGLVGFAYSSLTSAHAGSDPSADSTGNAILYNPLFSNMYSYQNVSPFFSMAIDRDTSVGGVMALGGIPDVPHAPYFASTPIEAVGINRTSGALVYEFYTIEIDGYAVSVSPSAQFNPYDNNNTLKIPLIADDTNVIVDSGTSLCYLPEEVVETVSAAFQPAATYDQSTDIWMVDCDAESPVLGISIGNKVFYINSEDLIIQTEEGCMSAIQSDNGGLTILGATWMKNVIAVFDIGAEMMHFAAREFYSTS